MGRLEASAAGRSVHPGRTTWSEGTRGWRVVAVALLLLLAVEPRAAPAQEDPGADSLAAAEGPVSPDSARQIREALARPAAEAGPTVAGVLTWPLDLALLPVELVGRGIVEVAAWVVGSELHRSGVAAYRAIRGVGVSPSVASDLGPASGPGIRVTYTGVPSLRLTTALSLRGYHRHHLEVGTRMGGFRLAARAEYRRHTREPFYGIGTDSTSMERVVFRRDRWYGGLEASRELTSGLRARVGVGWERSELGPGESERFPDVRQRFGPGELPGLDGPTRFWIVSAGLEADYTRRAEFQRSGIRGRIRGALLPGAGSTPTDLRQASAAADLYLPLNPRQLLVLGGTLRTVEASRGEVPFYLLPSAGGSTTLRSHEWGRFRHRDLVAGRAEWRYEVWRDLRERVRLEGTVFADVARVGPAVSELGPVIDGYGVGLRGVTLGGIEAETWMAFGDEGTRVGASVETGTGVPR